MCPMNRYIMCPMSGSFCFVSLEKEKIIMVLDGLLIVSNNLTGYGDNTCKQHLNK